MTDGNMAIPVSPVTEDEMNQIQVLFKKAADTLIAFSTMHSEVESMKSELAELRNATNRYRNQIDMQDEVMYKLRREREELLQNEGKAKQEADVAKADLVSLQGEYSSAQDALVQVNARLTEVRNDRDHAQYQVEELKEKVKGLEDTIAKFRDLARALEPVPTPQDLGEKVSDQRSVDPVPFPAYPHDITRDRDQSYDPDQSQEVKQGW